MQPESGRENNLNILLLHVLAIIISAIILYANSLNNGFVGDDEVFIQGNTYVKDLKNIPQFFVSTKTVSSSFPKWGGIIYRPLRTTSYAVDYFFFELNSTGYHVTNLVLYIISCILLYMFTLYLFDSYAIALISGLLFTFHPLHVEAVSWISSRADLIGFIFLMLSLICYMQYHRRERHIVFLLMSLAFSFLAYIGKETMVPLPGLIIVYDYVTQRDKNLWQLVKSNFWPWLFFALLCFGYLGLRYAITGRMSTDTGWWGGTKYSNSLMMMKGTAIYLKLILFPYVLNLHYIIDPVKTIFDGKVLISLLVILLSLAIIVYSHFKNRKVFFVLLWFYLGLVPIANIVPISFAMIAERYIFMPSAGPIIAMGYGIHYLYRRLKDIKDQDYMHYAVIILLTSFLIGFAVRVVTRNKAYKDHSHFFHAAVADSPNSAPNLKGLGDIYHNRKEYTKAIEYYERAIDVDHNYAEAMIAQAQSLQELGKHRLALFLARKAVTILPKNAIIQYGVGHVYRKADQWGKAMYHWQKAIELNNNHSEAYNCQGNYYLLTKNNSRALQVYQKSIAINPYDPVVHYNVALIYKRLRNREKMIEHYRLFVRYAFPEHQQTVDALKKSGILDK